MSKGGKKHAQPFPSMGVEPSSAEDAARAVARLQGGPRNRQSSDQAQTGYAPTLSAQNAVGSNDNPLQSAETQIYRQQLDEERYKRIESGIETNISSGLIQLKYDISREVNEHKMSILKWGIGIFVPTIAALAIYHLTVFQSFKNDVIDMVNNNLNKHDLEQARERAAELAKNELIKTSKNKQ